MTTTQVLIIIIGLFILAIWHAQTLIENRRLWASIKQNEETRSRHMYIIANNNSYMNYFINLDMEAYDQMGIATMQRYSQNGVLFIEYETGDQIMVINYPEAHISALPAETIGKYAHRLFFDYKLPNSAFRAVIHDLGLDNYFIGVGICTERSVENGKN